MFLQLIMVASPICIGSDFRREILHECFDNCLFLFVLGNEKTDIGSENFTEWI